MILYTAIIAAVTLIVIYVTLVGLFWATDAIQTFLEKRSKGKNDFKVDQALICLVTIDQLLYEHPEDEQYLVFLGKYIADDVNLVWEPETWQPKEREEE